MSTYLTGERIPRQKIDEYHREIIRLVEMIRLLPEDSQMVREFLAKDPGFISEPMFYSNIRKVWDSVCYDGAYLNVFNASGENKFRAFVRNLYCDDARQRCYVGILNGRLGCVSTRAIKPISIVELEQRYRYAEYRNNLAKYPDKDVAQSFEAWRDSSDCVTFYDLI